MRRKLLVDEYLEKLSEQGRGRDLTFAGLVGLGSLTSSGGDPNEFVDSISNYQKQETTNPNPPAGSKSPSGPPPPLPKWTNKKIKKRPKSNKNQK